MAKTPLRLSKIDEDGLEKILDGPLPLHTYDLIKVLDKMFPERYKRPGEDQEQHMFDSGTRGLINFLLAWQEATEEQNEDDDEQEDNSSSARIVGAREAPPLPQSNQ